MELTRERPSHRASSFDPHAVPQLADFPTTTTTTTTTTREWVSQDSQDLIDLGEEQLFTGTRTLRPNGLVGATLTPSVAHSGRTSPLLVVDESTTSLKSARHSFLLALSSLVQQTLDETTPFATPRTEISTPLLDAAWSHLSAVRRHSIAVVPPSPTPTEGDEALLSTLVRNLRAHAPQPSPTMEQLGGSPLLGATGEKDAAMEELQLRIEQLALDLPPVDAELATSLTSLLTCIDRLLHISSPSTSASTLRDSPNLPFTAPNLYVSLEREARLLQNSRLSQMDVDPETLTGAAREVQQAERELLWGRVDDLSERVGVLCRARNQLLERERRRSEHHEASATSPETSSKEVGGRQSLDYEESINGDLPGYADHPPAYDRRQSLEDSKQPSHDWEKPPPSPELAFLGTRSPDSLQTRARQRRTSNFNSEKMQRDLDSVSAAIERLYLVTPQLANQRVEPDRRQLRERQLAKLGNAIERLSKGRFDNQRATPSPVLPEQAEMKAELKAQRVKKVHEEQLDRLIEQIDRAASRTMLDQRVVLNGKRKQVQNLIPLDSLEDDRQRYILEHTGKGRLSSQDAAFHNGYTERFPQPPQLNEPVTITEFFKTDTGPDEKRPRSNSFPNRPIIKKRWSEFFQKTEDPTSATASPVASTSGTLRNKNSLRLFKKGSTPTSSRRGSYVGLDVAPNGLGLIGSGMSRTSSTGFDIHATSPLDYVAEEARNLGNVVVTFWPRITPVSSLKEEYEVVSVNGDQVLVAPVGGGSASRLVLPTRVIPQQATITNHGSYYETKLLTVPPSPTRTRPDLEVHVPLSAKELSRALPTAFACASCQAELVNSSDVTRYNALPSEHWAELLDAWMCHQDQTLSDDLMAKGKGIKPRTDEGLVATGYILFGRSHSKNWLTPEGSKGVHADSPDHLFTAHCAVCNALIGHHVKPLATEDQACLRLLKYATVPIVPPASEVSLPRYSLSCHLTTELLETTQAHACHRFVVEDDESGTPRLLLWLFNPAVRVTYTSSSPSAALLDGPDKSPSSDCNRLSSRTMNAVKIFYAAIPDDNDPRYTQFTSDEHSPPEHISYPLSVTQRLSSSLQASSTLYPIAKRSFGDLATGFLERL